MHVLGTCVPVLFLEVSKLSPDLLSRLILGQMADFQKCEQPVLEVHLQSEQYMCSEVLFDVVVIKSTT